MFKQEDNALVCQVRGHVGIELRRSRLIGEERDSQKLPPAPGQIDDAIFKETAKAPFVYEGLDILEGSLFEALTPDDEIDFLLDGLGKAGVVDERQRTIRRYGRIEKQFRPGD